MDDELRILHEAMVVKDRLRVLAEMQSSYWEELTSRGFDQSIAEQLLLAWSQHAYGMTFRALPDATMDAGLDELLGTLPEPSSAGPQPPSSVLHRAADDPSSVPPGEAWLQLVQDVEADGCEPGADEQAA